MDLLDTQGSPVVFPSPRRPGEPIDLTSLSQSVRRWCADTGMTPWQPRDLRRTMKTHLLERRPDLRDALDIWHNHGRTADVARRHYDRATYAAAKVEVAREIDAFVEEVERVAADRSDDALPGDRAVA